MQNQLKLNPPTPIIVETTQDGSPTLYLPHIEEHYHSTFGAIEEALHVYINLGLRELEARELINILEVGFGTGLNALLSYQYALQNEAPICYTAYERYPLSEDIIEQLHYRDADQTFKKLHSATWEQQSQIHPLFSLHKIEADFNLAQLQKQYDLVYFDAFSPSKQEEMWSEGNFRKIFNSLKPGGALTTYCSKGSVRRVLQKVGFDVEKHPGPRGKREVLRAIKPML